MTALPVNAEKPALSEGAKTLRAFEMANAIVAAVAIAATHLIAGPGPLLWGVMTGAGLAIVNIRAMIWLGGKITRAEPKSTTFYGFLFMAKMGILLATIWLCLSTLPITPIGLLLGISSVLPASLLMAVRQSLIPSSRPGDRTL